LALKSGFKAGSATDDHHEWCEQEPSQEWQHSGNDDIPGGFAEGSELRLLLVRESSKPLSGELRNAGGTNHDTAEIGRSDEHACKLGKWIGYLGNHDPKNPRRNATRPIPKHFPSEPATADRASSTRTGKSRAQTSIKLQRVKATPASVATIENESPIVTIALHP
jgi:hypothetical protein